jgi:hypothetical protein
VRGGGSVQLGACVGAMCEVVGSVCSGFDAVYEQDMAQPLDNVRVELCVMCRDVFSR